jgi:hypothetical protein
MTVTAQGGFFAFAPQNDRSDAVGYSAPAAWYRHRAYDITFGPVQDERQFPLEVGGVIVPTGAFKAGAFVAGGARLTPRLEGDFGWLLHAAFGSASSGATAESGVYKHIFCFNTDPELLPWMQVMKYIPGSVEKLLEVGTDCKLAQLAFTIPQSGIVVAEPVFVGRIPTWEEDPSLTGYGAFEGPESVPVSMKGSLMIDSVEMPVVGATVTIANNVTTPQQEMIIGSYNPDDFVPLSRALQIRFTYKWADPDFYQKVMTGAVGATDWSPAPFYGPADITVESPGNITGKNQPWSLRIVASKINWHADGPPQLSGGNIIAQDYVGTANDNDGGEYCRIEMVNTQANYTWPS